MKRFVFFISDGTGLTAENLGSTLLTQFENLDIETRTLAYIDTLEKAEKVVAIINAAANQTNQRPLLFTTLTHSLIRDKIAQSQGFLLDLMNPFIELLEDELHLESIQAIGRSHRVDNYADYDARIAAIHYTLDMDDGLGEKYYDQADVIILGVSRAGKTPTCLYLAVQFGLCAANYPITEEDLARIELPKILLPYTNKLFGLMISADRLQLIREKRQPNSRYASLAQCQDELSYAEKLFKKYHIPYLDTTQLSIEEISGRILAKLGLKREQL